VRRWEEEESKASERQRRVNKAGRQADVHAMPLSDTYSGAEIGDEPWDMLVVAVRLWRGFMR
jgi:hypothetical protein